MNPWEFAARAGASTAASDTVDESPTTGCAEHSRIFSVVASPRDLSLQCRLIRSTDSDLGAIDMDLLTWLIVGLVAGVLASFVMGGGAGGLIGDIIIGIVGAFLGGWLFRELGVHTPFAGLGGTIFVAFVGAVVLLFLLRLVRGGRRA